MALRLHFNWLALTLQRSAGSPLRELLPSIVQHTKEATAAKLAMEQFEENMKREKDSGAAGKNARERQNNDAAIKKLYDQVVSKPVSSGIVAQSLRIEPLVNEAAQGNGKGQAWEMSASNVDGIFTSIILPELRAQKDPRVLEYWDMKLRTGAEDATRNKLAFEADKFNNITRPQLLWQRAQDMVTIGQQNRAVGEMFTIVKTYPSHPNATAWMSSLEQLLSQALAPAPAPAAAAAAPVPGAAPQTP